MENTSSNHMVRLVTSALANHPEIDMHHYPIRVHYRESGLILEGEVENIAAKRCAAAVVRRIAHQVPVLDHLRVVPAEPEEDGALRDEVVRNLSQESAFNDYLLCETRNGVTERIREGHNGERGWIGIEAVGGVVRLSGQVGSLTHRRLADVLAWWSGGCEDVQNDLRVVPAEKDNDGELADAVRIVLEKDPLVHADQLRVRARDGRVTLQGSVSSREEKRLARLDAWYVLGVHEVQDSIQTHG